MRFKSTSMMFFLRVLHIATFECNFKVVPCIAVIILLVPIISITEFGSNHIADSNQFFCKMI